MKWNLFKGFWDRWLKEEDEQARQWFRDLDTFLSRAFRSRISVRDNLFTKIYETRLPSPNSEILIPGYAEFLVDGAIIFQCSEPATLTWRQENNDFIFKINTASTEIQTLKLCIFFRERE